jgi:hypothetical protein
MRGKDAVAQSSVVAVAVPSVYKKSFLLAISSHQATSQPYSLLSKRLLLLFTSTTSSYSEAIMTLSKAITIGLAALLAVPAVTAGNFDTCTAVTYDTFNSTSVQDKEPQFGPKGLYSTSTTGQCIYVDATANGNFATTHPADY